MQERYFDYDTWGGIMINNKELVQRQSLKHLIITVISIVVIALAIFLSIDRFMLHLNIMELTNRCYEINGFPNVERGSHLSKDYSFSCEK